MIHEQKNQSPNRTTILNQQTTLLPNCHEEDSISCLKDSLISMQYRIRTLQAQVHAKMERQQCLTLLERKSNTLFVRKGLQQIYSKIQADRVKQEANIQKMEQQQKRKINDLKKKLKQVNNNRQGTQFGSPLGKDISSFNFSQNMSKKLNKVLIKPQQLYLQSNETMFSMLIDEIKQLKQRDILIERLIESKHKKTISLNNEVCRKLQHLEGELEQTFKYIDSMQSKTITTFQYPDSKKLKKPTSRSDKPQMMQKFEKNVPQTQAFQSIRIQLLSKSMQVVQRQLSQKLNIKDIVPLIKQNIPTFEESVHQIKAYVDQNFESMRKILENQSEINEEISKSNRVAWWHCYQKFQFQQSERTQSEVDVGYILFSKEIMNIIPENLCVQQDEQHTLKVLIKGWYLVNIYELEMGNQSGESRNNNEKINSWIEVNNGIKHPFQDKMLLNLAAGSQLRIITCREDLFVQVQKL